jgi:hypothetical protein
MRPVGLKLLNRIDVWQLMPLLTATDLVMENDANHPSPPGESMLRGWLGWVQDRNIR